MKKSFIRKGILFLTGLVFAVTPMAGGISTLVAHAGKSEQQVVTEGMYKDELSNQKWYMSKDISHEDGKIVFEADKTNEESKIVSVILANDLREMGIETCLNGSVTLNVKETLAGEFYVGFGLRRPYSEVQSASAFCLYDVDGSIGLRVENFDGEDAGVVYTATTGYAYGEDIVIDFDVYSVGSMYLNVNSTTLINHNNEKAVSAVGYFGFGQSAPSSVEIFNAEVRAATYDNPTNANVNETFSNGFNASLLYSEAGNSGYYTPEKVVCEDGVLKFTNVTSTGYISTKYEFSNFKMTYDIPHIQRVAEIDEDGAVITPATNWMGISIGCSSVKTNSAVAVAQSLFFYMMPTYVNGQAVSMSCVLLNNYNILKQVSVSNDYNFFSPANGLDGDGNERTVNLKVEMIDGKLQVFAKYANEPVNRYYKLLDYDLGYTPLGYVQIWGYGDDFSYVMGNLAAGRESYCANYWIDNLKVENADENPNLVEVDFTSSKFPKQDDYLYVDGWNNRAETLTEEGAPKSGGCAGSIAVSSIALVAMVGGIALLGKGGNGKWKKEE